MARVMADPPETEDSLRGLLEEIAWRAKLLVKKEVQLAKDELRSQVRSELMMLGGFAAATVCGIVVLTLLALAVVAALAESGVMAAWAATLLMAAAFAAAGAAAALIGWRRRVRTPLEITCKTLEENVRWAKERLR